MKGKGNYHLNQDSQDERMNRMTSKSKAKPLDRGSKAYRDDGSNTLVLLTADSLFSRKTNPCQNQQT